jgi:hypothetical protein
MRSGALPLVAHASIVPSVSNWLAPSPPPQ